jgi:cytochrome b pre-mRNA-processing protein 3
MRRSGKHALHHRRPLLSFFSRLFGRFRKDDRPVALYRAIVQHARLPVFYLQGTVPDTVEGRFEMVSTVTALVRLRLEADGESMGEAAARLTELFVDDMDGQLREMGIGDIVVGKHIGKMMALLGGRISAVRDAIDGKEPLRDVLVRNIWRGETPDGDALSYTEDQLLALHRALSAMESAALIRGEWVTL